MGKLGKETKNLLLAITVICLISFLLAAGLSFLLAKDFQHEMLLHDYGVSGYQLNHEDKLQISAFTAHPNESDIERGNQENRQHNANACHAALPAVNLVGDRNQVEVVFHFRLTPNSFSTPSDILKMRSAALA